MRVNQEGKSVDIERRDINYILPAYIRAYMFYTRNEDPEKIIFPMFRSVPHPVKKGTEIPIEWVPDNSPVAVEITEDGGNIPETTPEAESEADKKEEDYNAQKARIAELESEVNAPDVSPARATLAKMAEELAAEAEASDKHSQPKSTNLEFGDNQPSAERLAAAKAPDVVLPPGTPSDYGGSRDKRDQQRIARDLAPEKEVNEAEEREDSGLVERAKENKES